MKIYQDIIEVITKSEPNYKEIALYIAKHHPQFFMDAFDSTQVIPKSDLMSDDQFEFVKYKYITNGENKIQTIKDIRIEFNLGLKEAKDIVDEVISKFSL